MCLHCVLHVLPTGIRKEKRGSLGEAAWAWGKQRREERGEKKRRLVRQYGGMVELTEDAATDVDIGNALLDMLDLQLQVLGNGLQTTLCGPGSDMRVPRDVKDVMDVMDVMDAGKSVEGINPSRLYFVAGVSVRL